MRKARSRLFLSRFLKDTAARGIAKVMPKLVWDKKCFEIFQEAGFHVTPNLFYFPVPDTRTLDNKLWEEESELVGIDMNLKGQLRFLREIIPQYKEELNLPREKTSITKDHDYYLNNLTFGGCGDAEALHSMIRFFKPKRVVEIGSGLSTFLSARACLLNREKDGVNTELIAIEPYPTEVLKRGFPGLTRLIQEPLEEVNLDLFQSLEANDILFIDSTHVLKIGGDVKYEYLEILPRLRSGVIVHSHDIFFPDEYPKKWILDNHYFWTEQYLLQAFLAFNSAFEVLWASHYMYRKYPNELKTKLLSYQEIPAEELETVGRGPGSLWIRRKLNN